MINLMDSAESGLLPGGRVAYKIEKNIYGRLAGGGVIFALLVNFVEMRSVT